MSAEIKAAEKEGKKKGRMESDIAFLKKGFWVLLGLDITLLLGVRVMDPTLLPWLHWP